MEEREVYFLDFCVFFYNYGLVKGIYGWIY